MQASLNFSCEIRQVILTFCMVGNIPCILHESAYFLQSLIFKANSGINLCPSQQFFSYVRTGLPGLNQYYARVHASCSRTQHSDAGEARNETPQS